MRTKFTISVLALLLMVASSPCFAMMSIANVSKERAKELGMEIRTNAAGPEAVRVELEFATKGALESFSRVDLEFREGEKFLVTSSLREERLSLGHVLVSFAADRAHLDKITLRVVVQSAHRDMTGYDIRVKDFVELESQPKSMLEYELLRTPQQKHGRSTIWLYVKPQRKGVFVTARFHLCSNGEDLARFPLQRLDKEKGRVPSVEDDGRLLFMAECVAEHFMKESFVQLAVTDERSGQPLPGVRIQLENAAIWKGP